MADAPPPATRENPITTVAVRTFEKNEINRQRGRSLWFRVEVEGWLRATAWREVVLRWYTPPAQPRRLNGQYDRERMCAGYLNQRLRSIYKADPPR